jgi:hypothetical protein
MSDAAPKDFIEAVPAVLFGIYGFAFGFEAVVAMNDHNITLFVLDTVACLACAAIAILWLKHRDWLPQKLTSTITLVSTDARWLLGSMAVLLLVSALAPYIEQHRWPFSTIIHDAPTAEDTSNAAEPIRRQLRVATQERDTARSDAANLQSQLSTKQHELEVAQAALDAERRSKVAPSPQIAQPVAPPQMGAEEKSTRTEIWKGVDEQMTVLAKALNQGYALLDSWPTDIKSDRPKTMKAASDFNIAMNDVKNTLQNIYTSYLDYGDIAEALRESSYIRSPTPATVFDKISYSLGAFMHQLQILPEPLPRDFEGPVKLSATALRRDITSALGWQSKTRKTAADKINELSSMGSK